MKTLLIASLLTAATNLSAQTQTLRGKVEDVRGTVNQFFLDCTTIPVVSNVLNLNLLVGQDSILDVTNIGTATSPILNVQAATPTTKVFDMGNLRVGQTTRWEVNAAPGSLAFVFFDFTSSTRYVPFGGFGTFLLGPGAVTVTSGTTNGAGQFQFNFTVPPSASVYIGTSFTGQALVATAGNWSFSNADCRDVE
jgi:hypothetical protein